jgi:hypothetical protein
MKKVNLEIIYRKVKQRIKRSSSELEKELAKNATELARNIKNDPTLISVSKFRKAENKWLNISNKNSVSIADEFEKAIRSKNFIVGSIYNSSATGFNPKSGYLYCFYSDEYPTIVKIGSTTTEVHKRLVEYKSRHKFSHLEILFSMHTDNPSEKEKKLHDLLSSNMLPPESIIKSTEWFEISKRKAIRLIKEYA